MMVGLAEWLKRQEYLPSKHEALRSNPIAAKRTMVGMNLTKVY
jgi:hypothetical protein